MKNMTPQEMLDFAYEAREHYGDHHFNRLLEAAMIFHGAHNLQKGVYKDHDAIRRINLNPYIYEDVNSLFSENFRGPNYGEPRRYYFFFKKVMGKGYEEIAKNFIAVKQNRDKYTLSWEQVCELWKEKAPGAISNPMWLLMAVVKMTYMGMENERKAFAADMKDGWDCRWSSEWEDYGKGVDYWRRKDLTHRWEPVQVKSEGTKRNGYAK